MNCTNVTKIDCKFVCCFMAVGRIFFRGGQAFRSNLGNEELHLQFICGTLSVYSSRTTTSLSGASFSLLAVTILYTQIVKALIYRTDYFQMFFISLTFQSIRE